MDLGARPPRPRQARRGDAGDGRGRAAPAPVRPAGLPPGRSGRAGHVMKATRCIECEEIQLARVSDARPVQALPVPTAALAGFPHGRSAIDLTRRRLLQLGLAGVAGVYGPRALRFEEVWDAVAHADTGAPCLVLLYLAGGNDGLNMVVPQGNADWAYYQAQRPTLYRDRGPTVPGRMGSTKLAGGAGGGPGGGGIRRSARARGG